MNFVQSFQKRNHCYKNAVRRDAEGIVLDVIRIEEASAAALLRQWNTPQAAACPHAIVQKDRITQLLPWEYKGREDRRGSHSTSRIHILLLWNQKMETEEEAFAGLYENTVQLCAVLCKKYGLVPQSHIACYSNRTIFSHFVEDVMKEQEGMDYHCLAPFTSIVTASVVVIRSGPGEQYPAVAFARQEDVCKISSRKDGWGRLEEGKGYIRLVYTKKKKEE